MNDSRTEKTAQTVLAQFDKLTSSYTRVFNMCFDALAPGKTQKERNALRDALKEYIDKK